MAEELFWTKWAAIGQILGALGSFAAVVVSLYLARRAEKPKLRLSAGIRLVIRAGDQPPFPQIIDITVRNSGSLTGHVSQYGWQTGSWFLKWPRWLTRQHAVQMTGNTSYGMNPPLELPPGTRRSTILDYDKLLEGVREKNGEPFFARTWPLLGLRPTTIFVVAHLESGLVIKERVEAGLAKALFRAEADRLEPVSKPEAEA